MLLYVVCSLVSWWELISLCSVFIVLEGSLDGVMLCFLVGVVVIGVGVVGGMFV